MPLICFHTSITTGNLKMSLALDLYLLLIYIVYRKAFIFLCMTMTDTKKHFSRRKLYFLLVAIAGIIGSIICVGGVLFQLLNNWLITDDEYLHSSRNSYYVTECENGPYNENLKRYDKVSEADAAECVAKKEKEILMSRSIDFKESLIGFMSWGILFVILLSTHLPAFLNSTRKD